MSEKCGTHRKTQGMGLQDVTELKEESDGGSGGREKQASTEGRNFFSKGEKKKKARHRSHRGLWSEGVPRMLFRLPLPRWNIERSCLLLSLPLTLSFCSVEKEPSSSLSRPLPCGCQLISFPVLPLLLRLWTWPCGPPQVPILPFLSAENFSQRISLNVFCFSPTPPAPSCNGSAEF